MAEEVAIAGAIEPEAQQEAAIEQDAIQQAAEQVLALQAFKQRLMALIGLTQVQLNRVVEQGIDSVESLSIFDDDDIDQVFATANLRTVATIRSLRFKGLAGWLRDKNDHGQGFPIESITMGQIDVLLRERAQNRGRYGTARREKDETKAVAPPPFNGLHKGWLTLRKQVESYLAMSRNSKDEKMYYVTIDVQDADGQQLPKPDTDSYSGKQWERDNATVFQFLKNLTAAGTAY
jgi:hypothetical protein